MDLPPAGQPIVRLAEKLRDKRVFVSDGVRVGTAALVAECGRVMAVVDVADLPDELLTLTDTVCLNHEDAARVPDPPEV